jgi:hypothetical protein
MPHQDVTPALRWAMWRPPKASTASATAAVLAAGSVTSVRMNRPSISSATVCARDVDVGDHHARAALGQMPGHALTDAVAPSRDEGDLAVDVECHASDRRGTCSAQLRRGAGRGWAWTMLRCCMGRVMAT